MAIKKYKKGDSTKLSANFRAREFDCPGSGCCSKTPIDEKLVAYLQKIRDHFGKPVYITAYRCPTHNAKVANAAPKSYHTFGQAADFHIDGVKPAEIAKYAESIGIKGIGLYEEKDGNFVHIDTRTSKSFWYGHAQERRTTFGGAVAVATEKQKICSIDLPILTKGDTGEAVKTMQNLLIVNGYSCGEKGADGQYGTSTEKALHQLKKDRGLKVTSSCGKQTWAALLGIQ